MLNVGSRKPTGGSRLSRLAQDRSRSAYPTVFHDASGIWRCLYQGKPRAEPQEPRYPLLLESGDGMRWQAPDLTRAVPLDERRFRNQVVPVTPVPGVGLLLRRPRRGPDGAPQGAGHPPLRRHQPADLGRRPARARAAGSTLARRERPMPPAPRSGTSCATRKVTDPEGRLLPGYTFADA